MAKHNSSNSTGNSDDGLGTLKGVLMICGITGLGIYMSYNAGSRVSDRILKQVNKERKKSEKERRREAKERKKEEKWKQKIELIKAKIEALRGGK